MLRLSKLTDYGTVVLAHMAMRPDATHSAAELAAQTRVGLATVSKLLKQFNRGGLLVSVRGAHGGYSLARSPEDISAVDIIDAIEGPVALTECSSDHSQCGLETVCGVGHNWQRINLTIREALRGVTLAQLIKPAFSAPPVVKIDVSAIRKPRTN